MDYQTREKIYLFPYFFFLSIFPFSYFYIEFFMNQTRGVIESDRYKAEIELDSIKKLEAQTQSNTRKIVELLELDSTKLKSIKN